MGVMWSKTIVSEVSGVMAPPFSMSLITPGQRRCDCNVTWLARRWMTVEAARSFPPVAARMANGVFGNVYESPPMVQVLDVAYSLSRLP